MPRSIPPRGHAASRTVHVLSPQGHLADQKMAPYRMRELPPREFAKFSSANTVDRVLVRQHGRGVTGNGRTRCQIGQVVIVQSRCSLSSKLLNWRQCDQKKKAPMFAPQENVLLSRSANSSLRWMPLGDRLFFHVRCALVEDEEHFLSDGGIRVSSFFLFLYLSVSVCRESAGDKNRNYAVQYQSRRMLPVLVIRTWYTNFRAPPHVDVPTPLIPHGRARMRTTVLYRQ